MANRFRFPRPGIRTLLLALLAPGIVTLILHDSWNDYRTITDLTKDAYDRVLLEPARVLESSVEIGPDGRLRSNAPLYAQVLLESHAGLRKYHLIEEIDSLVEPGAEHVRPRSRVVTGMPELPYPPVWPSPDGQPVFYDAYYRDEPVRMVAVVRNIYQHPAPRQVLVMVAESDDPRVELEDQVWRKAFLRDTRLLVLIMFMVWLGVAWALAPLMRLRQELLLRPAHDMLPLDADRVPSEVAPLVHAVNHHMERHRRMLAEQIQFLDDASHQIRTPLAIMMTQAEYALRETDSQRMRESLLAIVRQLARTRRLTEQLLALAHAGPEGAVPGGQADLAELARDAVLEHLPLAHEKNQDLGWADSPGQEGGAIRVKGDEAELHEVLSNLIHNAIQYCPPGARITVSAGRDKCWGVASVCDDGPGVHPSRRERAFMRFDRAGIEREDGAASGSGLGLAIARAYARRHGGDVELGDGEPNMAGSVGLCATLRVPLDRGDESRPSGPGRARP